MTMGLSATLGSSQKTGEIPGDRRSAQRYRCQGTAEVNVLGGALKFHGELLDLSVSGCRVQTQSVFRLERGTQVEILMRVNQLQVRVAGGVRGKQMDRVVGLAFSGLSRRAIQMIEQLIAELAAESPSEQSGSRAE